MESLPIYYRILNLRSMSRASIVKTCLAVHLEIEPRMIVSYFINRRMQSKLGVLKIITYSYRVSSDTSVDKILIRYASTVYNFLLDLELLRGSSITKKFCSLRLAARFSCFTGLRNYSREDILIEKSLSVFLTLNL